MKFILFYNQVNRPVNIDDNLTQFYGKQTQNIYFLKLHKVSHNTNLHFQRMNANIEA